VEGSSNYGKRELIELIFLMITTCHECVPSSKGGYEGPSPDEVALVNAAAMVGFKFVSSENKTITVEYGNTRQSFDILKLVEFDSDRKRMTLVLRSSS
jgi:magnesium-transporting ATPase (P-type)